MDRGFLVNFYGYDNKKIGFALFDTIADAMVAAKSIGYSVEVVDNQTGEILWSREGREIGITIFDLD